MEVYIGFFVGYVLNEFEYLVGVGFCRGGICVDCVYWSVLLLMVDDE